MKHHLVRFQFEISNFLDQDFEFGFEQESGFGCLKKIHIFQFFFITMIFSCNFVLKKMIRFFFTSAEWFFFVRFLAWFYFGTHFEAPFFVSLFYLLSFGSEMSLDGAIWSPHLNNICSVFSTRYQERGLNSYNGLPRPLWYIILASIKGSWWVLFSFPQLRSLA